MEATVKWFNDSKGYGFATLEDGREVFCHYTQINKGRDGFKTLREGQKIKLALYETHKGLEAKDIESE